MERLPEDVANERLHHDIVRLLREHTPRSPQMAQVVTSHVVSQHSSSMSNGLVSHQQSQMQPQALQRTNTQPKAKSRRPKSTVMAMPNTPVANTPEVTASVKRSASMKKKREVPNCMPINDPQTSPANSLESPHGAFDPAGSPFDSLQFVNLGHFHEIPTKQPPPYDECIKTAHSMTSLHQLVDHDNNPFSFTNMMNSGNPQRQQQPPPQNQTQSMVIHQRQQSMPASFSPPTRSVAPLHQHPTTPHSSPQYVHSPHVPQVTSPGKLRPALPTSPTHMAALRQAAASSGFEFPPSVGTATFGQPNQSQQASYYPHYPTPPSQHSGVEATPQHAVVTTAHDAFPTPSPESPGQWSSASPHSQSDWSEGVRSPLGPPGSQPPQHVYKGQVVSNTGGHQPLGLPTQGGHGSIYI